MIKIDGLKNLKDPETHEPIVPLDQINKGKPIFQFSDKEADEYDVKEGLPELVNLKPKWACLVWLKPLFKRYYDAAQRWNRL